MIKEIQFHDQKIKMDDANGSDYTLNIILNKGFTGFEYPILEIIYKFSQAYPGIYVDAGANTGLFSIIYAKQHAGNKVLAFECVPSITEQLKTNIRLNNLVNRISVEEYALSAKDGTASFKVTDDTPGFIPTCSTLVEPIDSNWVINTIDVQTKTLDHVLQAKGLNEKISFIHLDVEGAEDIVCIGAKKTIAEDRPVLIVELLEKTNFKFFNSFVKSNDYFSVLLHADRIEIESNITYHKDGWNHALVPAEKLTDFIRIYEEIFTKTT